ncbi:UNVERIFIED_CONTAM: hypothetical protein K2H54_054074 [Gekko kuhli]
MVVIEKLEEKYVLKLLVLPVVKFISPSTGPKAGGTKVTIIGNNLNVGSELRVLVNSTKECRDLSRTDTTITCTMPGVEITTTVRVCIQFENKSCISDNCTFTYEKNPVITNISPQKSQVRPFCSDFILDSQFGVMIKMYFNKPQQFLFFLGSQAAPPTPTPGPGWPGLPRSAQQPPTLALRGGKQSRFGQPGTKCGSQEGHGGGATSQSKPPREKRLPGQEEGAVSLLSSKGLSGSVGVKSLPDFPDSLTLPGIQECRARGRSGLLPASAARLPGGGRIITVEGNGFLMAQNVSMVVPAIGKEQTNCKVHTDTVITCPSPAASNITMGSKPAPVDFYINGRLYAEDSLFPLEHPEDVIHISKFHLEYYANPQFFTAKKEKWIKHHPGEPLTLVIHKEPDNLGLESNEYEVKIGLISCEIQIVSDKVIHCSVNESFSTSERQLPVTKYEWLSGSEKKPSET